MTEQIEILEGRLSALELVAKEGVIPGHLDIYELEQMIGRIKELKFVIHFLKVADERL